VSSEETRVLSEIRERVVRLETKIDAMTDVRTTADEAKEKAIEALDKAKSAHHRLDEIKDNQKWLWRTVAGTIIAGVIGALINFNGG